MDFVDLKRQYCLIKEDVDKAILAVLNKANFILGEEVSVLEEKLAEYVGVKHCITCANGTDALTLALKTLGVEKGDAVFVPSFTYFASGEVIPLVGATPVFVDVKTDTFNICESSLKAEIEKVIQKGLLKPKAIISVDLFGQCADYNAIEKLAKKYNLKIVEDSAQGFGGSINGKRACSFGDIATTSFYPAKPLGCYGDGGACFTNNPEYAEILKSLRYHGIGKDNDRYDNVRLGYNSRLDTIQAAVLDVKLDRFRDFELKRRNEIAEIYNEQLGKFVTTPTLPEGFESSYAAYTIQTEKRDKLREHLQKSGVPTMVYYPKGLHRQKGLENFALGRLKNTEELEKTVLSLPVHPYLEDKEVEFITKKTGEFFEKEKQ